MIILEENFEKHLEAFASELFIYNIKNRLKKNPILTNYLRFFFFFLQTLLQCNFYFVKQVGADTLLQL